MTARDGRPRLLLVDDEASIRSSLRRLFLDQPWEPCFARDGEEGLALLRENDFDLVLADFRMPGLDGLQFLTRAKKMRPDCMRILFSGYADIRLIVSALNEGEVYRFVSKPWNDGELLDIIGKALAHHRLNREIENLRRAHNVLERLQLPVFGVASDGAVVFANPAARRRAPAVIGGPPPDLPGAQIVVVPTPKGMKA